MFSMAAEVRAWREVVIVKIEIQVVGLEIRASEDGGHSGGEFAKALIDELGHVCDTGVELFSVGRDGAADLGTFLPGSCRCGVKGSTWPKFTGYKGIDRGAHIGEMGRTETRVDTG